MVFGREIRQFRVAVVAHFDIIAFIRAFWHIVIQNIRQAQQHGVEIITQSLFTVFKAGHFGFNRRHFSHDRLSITALFFNLTNLAGGFIALLLQVLQCCHDLAAVLVNLKNSSRLFFKPTARHGIVKAFSIITNKPDVMHGKTP